VVTYFDQSDEQYSTDHENKEGKNVSGVGPARIDCLFRSNGEASSEQGGRQQTKGHGIEARATRSKGFQASNDTENGGAKCL
jgi:hypothetical protein